MFRSDDTKTLTAHFPRTISIYEGSDVRVLGVPVGTVDRVTPVGHRRRRDDALRRRRQGPGRRQGRDRRAVDRRRPVRPADPGLRRRRRDGRRRDARRGPHRRTARARPDLLEHRRPDRRARPDRRQQGRRAVRPARDAPPRTSAARARSSTRRSRTSASSARPSTTTRRSSSAPPASSRASSAPWPTNDETVRRFNDSLADVSTMLVGRAPGALGRAAATSRPRSARCRRSSRRTATSWAATSPGLNRVSKVLVKRRGELDRDPRRGPARAQQPGADLQPAGRHARHQRQPRRARQPGRRPTRRRSLCGILGQADSSGALCDLVQQALPRRPRRPGRARRRPADRFDPTLGGLVGADR